ncbi:LiaI-LiaF-like domain-containing protein [Geobacillus sp. C56-T2]|uniref:LiaI-LiaF-like domain-containing protein n=1 Tax=Geobacillus sp. C56-T2 TaxID=600773 RepID=UPI0011A26F58|nr:DUF5668 domain-containing protein [Geobacillus sp. C56-T2]NNV05533.1 hypothetical protein [Geobacillus sp. MMMUD3]TWG31410.1 hypothetical protein GC56T2_2624 [Geobacillus sp. C56-T2]
MKNKTAFSGILFIGLGLYFLAGQLEVPVLRLFQGWPALLAICGASLLGQAYSAREHQFIFPGFLLLGFGLELMLAAAFPSWPRGVNVFFLIMAIAFFASGRKQKSGAGFGALFLLLFAIATFSGRGQPLFSLVQAGLSSFLSFWPLGLVAVGVYLLWARRK